MPQIPALPIIRSAVSQGLSANQAYRLLQQAAQELTAETGEAWTGMNRQTFLRTYSATVAMRARVPQAMNLPKDVPPGATDIVPRPTVRASGYGNWAIVFSRLTGSAEVEQEFYFQRTNEPLSPQEIENMAQRDFENGQQQTHGTKAGFVFMGATYVGTELLQPEG